MNYLFEEKVLQEKAGDFKATISRNLDTNHVIDQQFIANSTLREVLENYTLLINPEYTGKLLKDYQDELKLDIVEYFEDKEVSYDIESISKIAFFRLQKISKKHYLESIYGSNEEKIEALKAKATKTRKEYDIISALR